MDAMSTHQAPEDVSNKDGQMCLDGMILAKAHARVSVCDVGLMLDAGISSFLDAHIAQVLERPRPLIWLSGHARLMGTKAVKVQVLRHRALGRFGPTFVIITRRSKAAAKRGIKLVTLPGQRGLPMTQGPEKNLNSRFDRMLASIAAEKAGADEAFPTGMCRGQTPVTVRIRAGCKELVAHG